MTTTISSLAAAALASLATWIVHLIWPRTAPAPVASPVGTVNATNLNIAAKAESAGLGWLVPLLKALETANGPLIQVEARFLHRLVEQQGGFAKLLEEAADQILEARLASGRATYLVRFATDAGITPRELLDELEGKPQAPTSPVSLPAAATVALLLCLCLTGSATAAYPLGPNFAAGPGHWNADVHAPQAFYPTELNLVAEPRERIVGTVVGGDGRVIERRVSAVYAPDGSCTQCVNGQPVYYGNQPVAFWDRTAPRRWAAAPYRWFANRRFRPLARLFGRG
jgi:hypothetical protein